MGNLTGKNLDELNQAIDAEEKFNKSIERHLLDLSHPIICTLQMV